VYNKEAKAVSSIIDLVQSKLYGDGIAVSFSGGKDSLVALDLAVRAGVKKAVFCDTTIDFEQTFPYIEKIKNLYGIDLQIVRSNLDFFETLKYLGLPSRRARWCCDVFKFAPISKYGKNNDIKVFITGLRRLESNKRKHYSIFDQHPFLPYIQFNPILDWNDMEIWDYIHIYKLPYHPLYDKGFERIGCWCCPFNAENDWKLLKKLFPDKIRYLKNILRKQAEKIKITDKNRFINEQGWTSWISPIRKISVGKINSCQINMTSDLDVSYIEFKGKIEENIKRVTKLLPVLTDLFWITKDSKIKVILNKNKKNKLKLLIEKAINCISCGVCISLCPTGALKVDNHSIVVDESMCIHCGNCLKSSSKILRGSCIVRNYSNKSATMIVVRKD